MQTLQEFRQELEQRKGKKQYLSEAKKALEKDIRDLERDKIRHEKALEIVKQVALLTQKQLEYHLEEQVSLALESVFDDPYKMVVDFQEKRGKTEVELLFSRRGMSFPPIGNSGGGTIDVASLALRIAYWSMRQDKKTRPILLLDEPFSRLKGEDANRKALDLLREISRKLGIQIIMISDERIPREDIMDSSDRVFEVSQGKNGHSKVKIL